LAGDGKVLAGEAAREKVDVATPGSAVEGPHVVVSRYVRPVASQHGTSVWVGFDLESDAVSGPM